MSGKWFSNRGQVGQLIVAILALILGVCVAWPQIGPHMDVWALWPVAIVPVAAFGAFQAGRTTTVATPQAADLGAEYDKFQTTIDLFNPSIKVGAFWEGGDLRISIGKIETYKTSDNVERVGAQLIAKGGEVPFTGGSETKKQDYNTYLVPPSSSGVGGEMSSMFSFGVNKGFVYLTIVRVDHLNNPGQEVTLSVCRVRSVNRKLMFEKA